MSIGLNSVSPCLLESAHLRQLSEGGYLVRLLQSIHCAGREYYFEFITVDMPGIGQSQGMVRPSTITSYMPAQLLNETS